MLKETWRQFTLDAIALDVQRDATLNNNQFVLVPSGQATVKPPGRQPNATYALEVNTSGVTANATDPEATRHAWFTLLQLLQADGPGNGNLAFSLPHVEIQDWPVLKFRGLHLCVFPETTPFMIEKVIRLAAFFKFTHVVLEFWGMLRLEALRELSWPEAWKKSDARGLVDVARNFGLEVIPMFNCWGHAAASRLRFGRHVVLDQNPRLSPLFEPDGWTWCLTNPRAQSLLRAVVDELIDFAGPGSYFHIGCDEAYSHATCDHCREHNRVQLFADHVNELATYLKQHGRRTIMWGDALLERAKWPPPHEANSSPLLPTHQALERLSRRIVIADWQYGVVQGDMPTLAHFRAHGFETLACPWNKSANIRTTAKAAADTKSGLLMTTWQHLGPSIAQMAYAANAAWSQGQAALNLAQCTPSLALVTTASCVRKLMPAQGRYQRAGWNSSELTDETG